MPLLFELTLLLVGVAGGYVGSMTGLGGAVVIMPVLALFLGVPVEYAVGASLVSTIATSSGAAAAYVRDRITNIRIGMSLEIGTTLGAIIGALLAFMVYSHGLSDIIFIAFGLVLLMSLYFMLRRGGGARGDGPDWTTRLFRLRGSYYDRTMGKRISYTGIRWWLGETVMFFAGILSGLLGIGSGVLKVLGMDKGMHLPIKVSTATSDFMIGVTAVTGSAVYWALGYIRPALVAPVIVGVVVGSYLGSRSMETTRGGRLALLFSIVLAVVGIEMVLRGLGIA